MYKVLQNSSDYSKSKLAYFDIQQRNHIQYRWYEGNITNFSWRIKLQRQDKVTGKHNLIDMPKKL